MLFQVPVIGKGREQSQEKASRTHQHRPCAKAPGQQITGKKQGQWQQIDRRGSPQHRSALRFQPYDVALLRTQGVVRRQAQGLLHRAAAGTLVAVAAAGAFPPHDKFRSALRQKLRHSRFPAHQGSVTSMTCSIYGPPITPANESSGNMTFRVTDLVAGS